MIKIENALVVGWENAIRGMRNPMNSWEKSDSEFVYGDDGHDILGNSHPTMEDDGTFTLGPADYDLMLRLAKAGPVDGKFRRMIAVYADITAPLYWWKEFDTYKVGTVANSCSTMHKIADKEFTLDDFSHKHLTGKTDGLWVNADGKDFMCSALDFCQITCDVLNHYRKLYLESKDKRYWWQMIQLLPSSYNQKRTVMLNYEVLANIYQHRRNHKLDEWRELCRWIEILPYSEIITCNCESRKPKETSLSLKDRLVLSAYTGVLMCEVDEFNKFVAETLGRAVYSHEWATGGTVQDELREKLKPEFMRICGKND